MQKKPQSWQNAKWKQLLLDYSKMLTYSPDLNLIEKAWIWIRGLRNLWI